MKKKVVLSMFCVLILFLSACSLTPQFENQDAFFQHLNGVWLIENEEDSHSYFVFEDGQLYCTNDSTFSYALEEVMDNSLNKGSLNALLQLNFKTAITAASKNSLLGSPIETDSVNYKKGTIRFDSDSSDDNLYKQISVKKDAVIYTDPSGNRYSLTKLSDDIDFSGSHFEAIFNKIKADYKVSTSQFWTDTYEYGELIKMYHPEISGWTVTTYTEENIIYESNRYVTSITGLLSIMDSELLFTNQVNLTSNWKPAFSILYSPKENYIAVIDTDNMSLDMGLLVLYATKAVQNFPGALEYLEVCQIIQEEVNKGNYTIEDGSMVINKTINGITYLVKEGTNSTQGSVYVSVNETMTVAEIMQYMQEPEPEQTTPTTPEVTTPQVDEPVQTAPMHEVPYTTHLDASVKIYEEPDLYSRYIQSVGQDGIYTIVEEAYDDVGNLWGKLKSGLGWVMLEEVRYTSQRTCTQCGMSTPNVTFSSDTPTCDGCNYYSQGGGSDDRLICAQCGADCTFRGLEEDGLCEDCHFG